MKLTPAVEAYSKELIWIWVAKMKLQQFFEYDWIDIELELKIYQIKYIF